VAPIATGSAMEQKMSNSKNITVVYVGDGAAEEGVFYESLNFAAVFKLPILFVIENNLYSVNSPRSSRKSEDGKSYFLLRFLAYLEYWLRFFNS
jgi:pyruvate dehydrogenase E1 component alpha subunit